MKAQLDKSNKLNEEFYSGFVSLVGRPNVGKSTLMNVFVGEKVSIVSKRPQTTRNEIRGILTQENFQVVFVDTPGMHKPQNKLGEFMIKSIKNALGGVDVILYLVEPTPDVPAAEESMIEFLAKTVNSKVILVINKADKVDKPDILRTIEAYSARYPFAEIVPVSAIKADNTDALLNVIRKYLPEGPKYFPEDMITDQPERQIVAEMVREKALRLLQKEVPHGIAVEVTKMKDRHKADLIDIEATIYCESESHKPIVIGKGGEMLKKIGTSARASIESLLGSPVNLQLWVKFRKRWRDNDNYLRNLGYDSKQI